MDRKSYIFPVFLQIPGVGHGLIYSSFANGFILLDRFIIVSF